MKPSSRIRVLGAVVLVALGVGGIDAALANPAISKPVCRFIHFYRATEDTVAPMSAWERVVFSFLLASRAESKS